MGQDIGMYLSRLQGDDHQHHRDPAGTRGETVRTVRQQQHRAFTTLKEDIAKQHADPAKSPEGKRQAVAERAKKVDQSYLDAMRTEADTDVQRYRSLLFATPKSDKSEVLAFLSEQEIRAKYADAPPHVVLMAYQTAVMENNYERQRALTNGPLGSVVPADFQHRALLDHAKKSQPALLANYEQAVNLQEHLDSLHDQAQQVLTGLKEASPVPAVA